MNKFDEVIYTKLKEKLEVLDEETKSSVFGVLATTDFYKECIEDLLPIIADNIEITSFPAEENPLQLLYAEVKVMRDLLDLAAQEEDYELKHSILHLLQESVTLYRSSKNKVEEQDVEEDI